MDPAPKLAQYMDCFLKNSGHRSTSHRVLRHLIAGGTGTLLYMGLVFLLVEAAGLPPVHAVVISFLVFELFIYIINRTWVYATTEGHAHALPRFILITALTLMLNTGLMYMAVDVFNQSYILGLAATIVIIPPTNFLLNYYWAFR